jgi:hypothetical protein
MSDHRELLERFIQLQALSLVVGKITGEVFEKAVEGDWAQHAFWLQQPQQRGSDQGENGLTAARVDLVAAHMFAELSAASAWFEEQARHHADRANDQIVEVVARER